MRLGYRSRAQWAQTGALRRLFTFAYVPPAGKGENRQDSRFIRPCTCKKWWLSQICVHELRGSAIQGGKTRLKVLVFVAAILLTGPASAFDGGGWDDEHQSTTLDVTTLQSLPDYRSYHNHCLERELTMWGEVAELMTTVATATCTCEYIELEQAKTFDDNSRESAAVHCSHQATRANQKRLMRWALPIHSQRMKQQH